MILDKGREIAVSGSQRSQFTKEGALIFTDSSLFQGGRLFLPESCTVVLNGGISYRVEAAVFREVSVKSGRPPALNDFKSRWGDPWLLGAGATELLRVTELLSLSHESVTVVSSVNATATKRMHASQPVPSLRN